MGNEFFGFSPESFEQFARALAVAIFGSGVRSFGNGPDGGREATFRGEVPYPHPPTTCWSGYGVIQAKCKEKSESTQKDQDWAIKCLTDELESFVSNEKRNPKPEYYVFITNVELSSAAKGGKDRAEKLITSYYKKLPLKGHAVWDANQLTILLANHEQLRRRFREFLTTGDILSAMLAKIELNQPNSTHILSTFLERELRADETSRLDQAGNRTDDQLRLAQLFFDLPASTQPQIEAPEENVDASGHLPHGVLFEMLQAGSRKLDPKTLFEQEISLSEENNKRFPTRYVLLGGPGSGKSTLGQFFAQIHRAALLGRREPHLLEARSRRIIDETFQLCERESLPWPPTPRYPFRVDLNRFAKALASSEIKTLAAYLLSNLKNEHTLTHETLLNWLSTYPILLILDGLDEVPATSNRRDLVKTVDDFLAEARQMGTDIFVMATSRHQGYAGEFSDGVVALRHVLPLSPVRAMRYVEEYAKARFADCDPQKAQEVIAKLRESIKRRLTSQLMGSPLQVTFMATVVAAKGDPGEDRWQLFDSYYRTIYDRERQKAVPPYDIVLSKQQPTIDRLHHDIGFWLQYRGEMAGGTAVSLTIDIFEKLVDSYLGEIGREGSEKQRLVTLITDAARHRLVFLTSRVAGELSFDVRSLQEYMAAECLTSGDPELVKIRLEAIAPAPYWRNVFLFAASKCFVDTRSRHLQDTIRLLCEDLNNSQDHLIAATKSGSELALDILQSGAVAENPNYSRQLARNSLGLLQQPYLPGGSEDGTPADQRLAGIYHNDLENVFREIVRLQIGQTDFKRTLGTWPLLLRLCKENVLWAHDLLKSHWPSEPDQIKCILSVISTLEFTPFVRDRISDFLQVLSPSEAFPLIVNIHYQLEINDLLDALIKLINRIHSIRTKIFIHVPDVSEGFRINIVSIQQNGELNAIYEKFSEMIQPHPGWLPYILAFNFLNRPNRETLAQILDKCADGGWKPDDNDYYLSYLPWPLSNALMVAKSNDDLRSIAKKQKKSDTNGDNDWVIAEQRWVSEGIPLNKFIENALQDNPLSISADGCKSIFEYGSWGITHITYPDSFIRTICDTAQKIKSRKTKYHLTWLLCQVGSFSNNLTKFIEPAQLKALFDNSYEKKMLWTENYVNKPLDLQKFDEWLDFYDWLGRSDILYHNLFETRSNEWCDIFQEAFVSKKNQLGLLRMLGRLSSSGDTMKLIPPYMLNLSQFSEPRFKLAALLVRISQRDLKPDEVQVLADEAVNLLFPLAEEHADSLLFRTIEVHLEGNDAICNLILRLREKMPPEVPLGIAKCEKLLRRLVKSQSSRLQNSGELRKLQLPVLPETTLTTMQLL